MTIVLALQLNLPFAVPEKVPGFEIRETARYGPENLFEYINGGSELYIAYGLRQMLHLSFRDKAQEEIVLDIFEMNDPFSAFGLFTHNMEKFSRHPWGWSESSPNLTRLWFGKFYLTITSLSQSENVAAGYQALCAEMLRQFPDAKLHFPEVYLELPEAQMIPGTERYFTHPNFVNQLLFVSESDIWSGDAEAPRFAQALYRSGGRPLLLMILDYGDRQQAKKNSDRLAKLFSADRRGRFSYRGRKSFLIMRGRFLFLAFHAESSRDLDILEQEVNR